MPGLSPSPSTSPHSPSPKDTSDDPADSDDIDPDPVNKSQSNSNTTDNPNNTTTTTTNNDNDNTNNISNDTQNILLSSTKRSYIPKRLRRFTNRKHQSHQLPISSAPSSSHPSIYSSSSSPSSSSSSASSLSSSRKLPPFLRNLHLKYTQRIISKISNGLLKLNFIKLHYLYMLLLIIISSILIYPSRNMPYIDALYFGASACTQGGLNPVDLNLLNTWQQMVLYIIPMITNPIFINTCVVLVRLFYFEKEFHGIRARSKLQSKYRRTLTRSMTMASGDSQDQPTGLLSRVFSRRSKSSRPPLYFSTATGRTQTTMSMRQNSFTNSRYRSNDRDYDNNNNNNNHDNDNDSIKEKNKDNYNDHDIENNFLSPYSTPNKPNKESSIAPPPISSRTISFNDPEKPPTHKRDSLVNSNTLLNTSTTGISSSSTLRVEDPPPRPVEERDIRFGDLPHPRRHAHPRTSTVRPTDIARSISLMENRQKDFRSREGSISEGPALVIRRPQDIEDEEDEKERLKSLSHNNHHHQNNHERLHHIHHGPHHRNNHSNHQHHYSDHNNHNNHNSHNNQHHTIPENPPSPKLKPNPNPNSNLNTNEISTITPQNIIVNNDSTLQPPFTPSSILTNSNIPPNDNEPENTNNDLDTSFQDDDNETHLTTAGTPISSRRRHGSINAHHHPRPVIHHRHSSRGSPSSFHSGLRHSRHMSPSVRHRSPSASSPLDRVTFNLPSSSPSSRPITALSSGSGSGSESGLGLNLNHDSTPSSDTGIIGESVTIHKKQPSSGLSHSIHFDDDLQTPSSEMLKHKKKRKRRFTNDLNNTQDKSDNIDEKLASNSDPNSNSNSYSDSDSDVDSDADLDADSDLDSTTKEKSRNDTNNKNDNNDDDDDDISLKPVSRSHSDLGSSPSSLPKLKRFTSHIPQFTNKFRRDSSSSPHRVTSKDRVKSLDRSRNITRTRSFEQILSSKKQTSNHKKNESFSFDNPGSDHTDHTDHQHPHYHNHQSTNDSNYPTSNIDALPFGFNRSATMDTDDSQGPGSLHRIMSSNYLSYQPTVEGNSVFVDLNDEQKEELGGVEYRALKILAKILVFYFVGWHLTALVIIAPWSATSSSHKELFEEIGISSTWWGIFIAASSFNNVGLTLTPDSMASFSRSAFILVFVPFFMIIGNTGFPILLRCIIWFMFKVSKIDGRMRESLGFLLDHPRRCFTLLFPSGPTWWLFGVLVMLNVIDTVLFLILDLNNEAVKTIPIGYRIPAGLFQAIATRTTGFGILNIANLHPAVLVSYTIMMYINIFPVAMSVRSTNVYEEQTLGLYNAPQPMTATEGILEQDQARKVSEVTTHLMRQLSYDLWFMFIALFIICIAEEGKITHGNPFDISIFNILFEVTSAYGTVGLSTGYPTVNTSLSSEFSVIGKLVIIILLYRGRHRSLPYAIDRAIVLPKRMKKNDLTQEQFVRQRTYTTAATIGRSSSLAANGRQYTLMSRYSFPTASTLQRSNTHGYGNNMRINEEEEEDDYNSRHSSSSSPRGTRDHSPNNNHNINNRRNSSSHNNGTSGQFSPQSTSSFDHGLTRSFTQGSRKLFHKNHGLSLRNHDHKD